VPTRFLRLLGAELESHLSAHLAAEHLPHIQSVHARAAKAKKPIQQRKTELLAALPIHSASCGALVRNGFRGLRFNGWLLLVDAAPEMVALVELQEQGKQAIVTRVSTGELAEQMKKAVNRTSRYNGLQLRALRVPAMHLLAVWGHFPKRHGKDFVAAVMHNFAGLRLSRLYTSLKAEHILKQAALVMILRWYDRVEREMQNRRAGPPPPKNSGGHSINMQSP
jgi:hypothetical protein